MKWHPLIKKWLLKYENDYFLVKRGLAQGLYMHKDEHGLRTAFGFYERELIAYLKLLICSGDCCYDIGAASGYYTLLLGRLSGTHVYAFEAEAKMISILENVVQYNRLEKEKYSIFEAFIGRETNMQKKELKLDDFITEGHPMPDFLKMDIEGGEYDALLGFRETLINKGVKMIIETHGRKIEDSCIDFLRSLNYRIEVVDKAKYFQEARPPMHNRWLICRRS